MYSWLSLHTPNLIQDQNISTQVKAPQLQDPRVQEPTRVYSTIIIPISDLHLQMAMTITTLARFKNSLMLEHFSLRSLETISSSSNLHSINLRIKILAPPIKDRKLQERSIDKQAFAFGSIFS